MSDISTSLIASCTCLLGSACVLQLCCFSSGSNAHVKVAIRPLMEPRFHSDAHGVVFITSASLHAAKVHENLNCPTATKRRYGLTLVILDCCISSK